MVTLRMLARSQGGRAATQAFHSALRPRQGSSFPSHLYAQSFRRIHARALSYSAIPKVLAKAFRVPIAGATVGAGALGYANYKFEGRLKLFLYVGAAVS